MALDPYAILEVPPDADLATIKAAYRRKSKIHHPDKNPDDPYAATRMAQVNEAYEILKDPQRRARFDVGEDPRKVDIDKEARSMLAAYFTQLATRTTQPIVSAIRTTLEEQIEGKAREASAIDVAVSNLQKLMKRYRYNGEGEDMFAIVADASIDQATEKQDVLEHQIVVHERAIELLKDYEDLVPEPPKQQAQYQPGFAPFPGGTFRWGGP